jgi:hypothetical protein
MAIIPNTHQTPNILVDDLMPLLKDRELRVYLFAVRHIYGWQDKIERGYAYISLSMFEDGFSRFEGCGLTKKPIIAAINELCKYGLLVKIGDATNKGQAYAIGQNPDIDALRNRNNTQKSSSGVTPPVEKVHQKGWSKSTASSGVTPPNQSQDQNQDKHAPNGDVRPRDLVFDWLAVNMYNLNLDTINKSYGGRIAKTKRTLSEIHRNNGTELTPAHLDKFKSWWAREYSGLTMPRDAVKLSEYYLEFYGSHKTSPQSQEKRRIVLSMRAQSELGYDTITKGLFNDEIEAKIAEYERMEMS